MSFERELRLPLVLAGALTCGVASAQQAEVDPVAATLFRSGRELIQSGDYAAGCKKFRLSLARHASASTVLNIAKHCEERAGRIASAWALYQRALVFNRETPGDKRRAALKKIADEGIARLSPRLPKLRITVTNLPADARIVESDEVLPLEAAVPLDPGEHTVEFSAPGFKSATRTVRLIERETTELRFTFRPEDPKPVKRAVVEPVTQPHQKPRPRAKPTGVPPPDSGAVEPVPTWAWIAGGAGIVLTAVAGFFVYDAVKTSNDLEDVCGSDLICPDGFDPTPQNSRKNRGIGLAIGLGTAGLLSLTASAFGILGAQQPVRQGGTSRGPVNWFTRPGSSHVRLTVRPGETYGAAMRFGF